ncbi:MAG: NAD-dependent epimerase/dehydratase family protein [Candidatus Synoicihabitans palmerolidicus]|nr:NAD-dependent epimerase/dehydratase family protein [Candidatus Synoicihabitans palmerolidicus]
MLIDRTQAEVFAWHTRPGAFARLGPPWENVRAETRGAGIGNGSRVVLKSKIGPVWTRWEGEHFGYRENEIFCDRQIEGPFKSWVHRHRFESDATGGCWLIDEIDYELPWGMIGSVGVRYVERRLDRLFRYRHVMTKTDLELRAARCGRALISGASGMIGRALIDFLRTQGWAVDLLVRREVKAAREISWNPSADLVAWPKGYHCDAVIHLAGANIADGRWAPPPPPAFRNQEQLRRRHAHVDQRDP